MVKRPTYRLLFDWPRFAWDLREAGGRRRWTEQQIAAALQRDRLCTVEVDDLEAHLDWHERMGFVAPKFGASEA